ncbi:MAG: hypothetical protein LBB52_05945, partial [Desulfovibrio sp.]|nr:hypothetical protein [Desulfovibrio sp.]
MRARTLLTSWNIIFLAALAVLFLLVAYPMSTIFKASLQDSVGGGFTLKNYTAVFTTPFYWNCLVNSLFVSAAATFFSVI